MKLYYSPGACSQAAHILLHETGLPHSSEAVDLRAKRTASGGDYWAINPKGAVPALEIGDEVLTENGAVLQYIGDKAGNDTLLPGSGMERYRVIEWLAYLGSDVHKSFGPLWNPASSEDVKQAARDVVGKKFDFIEQSLEGRDYLAGPSMTIADPYLFAMLGWTGKHGIDLTNWPNLSALRRRMEQRETVRAVMTAEGLVEEEVDG
ncbi:MAG: glutathione binding-like protein [Pseudomonadota bacterium]|nr:glutathione binding-like protein [Pseudomonadota bacterium]